MGVCVGGLNRSVKGQLVNQPRTDNLERGGKDSNLPAPCLCNSRLGQSLATGMGSGGQPAVSIPLAVQSVVQSLDYSPTFGLTLSWE